MATPLAIRLRRSFDSFNQRPVWLLAHSDARLDGTVMATGTVDIMRQVAASAREINSRRAAIGLPPINAD